MATFVVKSNLNVTVSVIKNAPDDMQFVYVINTAIWYCLLVIYQHNCNSLLYASWQHQTCSLQIHCLKCSTGGLIKLLLYILFEKYIYILALEMASPGNQHCVDCIGTLACVVRATVGCPSVCLSRQLQQSFDSYMPLAAASGQRQCCDPRRIDADFYRERKCASSGSPGWPFPTTTTTTTV